MEVIELALSLFIELIVHFRVLGHNIIKHAVIIYQNNFHSNGNKHLEL